MYWCTVYWWGALEYGVWGVQFSGVYNVVMGGGGVECSFFECIQCTVYSLQCSGVGV